MAYSTNKESPVFPTHPIGHKPYALFFGREPNDEPAGSLAPRREMLD
jgi:hypothetical protein